MSKPMIMTEGILFFLCVCVGGGGGEDGGVFIALQDYFTILSLDNQLAGWPPSGRYNSLTFP